MRSFELIQGVSGPQLAAGTAACLASNGRAYRRNLSRGTAVCNELGGRPAAWNACMPPARAEATYSKWLS